MVLFASIGGLFQIFIICPRWKFISVDGRTNKSFVPIIITLLIIALISAMFLFFPVIATDLVSLVPLPIELYLFVIGAILAMLIVEIIVLKRNLLVKLIGRFETYYMDKLAEEYSKGDVYEEEGTNLNDLKNVVMRK